MSRRILLVDDEVSLRSIIARVLRLEEYEVTEASDGFEAWGLAKKTRFDLLITDSLMPHLSGSELVTRLRELYPTLPILRISGSRSEGMPRGVATLVKPFLIVDLVAAVRALLGGESLRARPHPLTPEKRPVLG